MPRPAALAAARALRVDRVVTESGWAQLPGRKDMAKLHFGNSSCQIEGVYVPVADMNLAAGEGVYFTHHVLLWKDPQVNVTTMSLAGAWKRMFAGMPLIMTQAVGPGHIAFSKDDPGELIPVPLQPGQSLDVREHLFLAATGNVEYDWFQTGIWFTTQNGNETETHYPLGGFMDRFSAPRTPGLLHAARRRQRVRPRARARADHSGKTDGAGFQGPLGANAPAFRTARDRIQRLGIVGQSLHLAAAGGSGPRRGAIRVRPD